MSTSVHILHIFIEHCSLIRRITVFRVVSHCTLVLLSPHTGKQLSDFVCAWNSWVILLAALLLRSLWWSTKSASLNSHLVITCRHHTLSPNEPEPAVQSCSWFQIHKEWLITTKLCLGSVGETKMSGKQYCCLLKLLKQRADLVWPSLTFHTVTTCTFDQPRPLSL